ncbi:hypothetical protein Tco_0097143 [Tanacetum coccineum]
MAARDSDDTLGCCVENTVEDRIMDSDASFHATYCKEELERFKLLSGKVRLADDKTLDIASIGDVVLKTYFSTSWTLRMLGTNMESMYMVEVHPKRIGAIINGSGSATVWFGEAEESFLYNVSEDKETAETATGVANGIVMLKMVPETPLQFGVAERLSRTFRAESMGIRAEAPKMLWADSVSTTYLIYRIPYCFLYGCVFQRRMNGAPQGGRPRDSADTNITDSLGPVGTLHQQTICYKQRTVNQKSYSEALSMQINLSIEKAIIEEMVSLEKNQTCSLVRITGKKEGITKIVDVQV